MENLIWLQPVLIGAAIVFVLDLIGNMLSFSNRFVNALTTAGVFALVFGALIQFEIVKLDVRAVPVDAPVATPAPAPAM